MIKRNVPTSQIRLRKTCPVDLPSGPLERARVQWFSVVSSGRLGLLPPDCGPWAMIACAFDGAVARALQHGAGGDPVRVWVSQAAGSFRP